MDVVLFLSSMMQGAAVVALVAVEEEVVVVGDILGGLMPNSLLPSLEYIPDGDFGSRHHVSI